MFETRAREHTHTPPVPRLTKLVAKLDYCLAGEISKTYNTSFLGALACYDILDYLGDRNTDNALFCYETA